MTPRSFYIAPLIAAALLASCGEPVDPASLQQIPDELPPPAAVPDEVLDEVPTALSTLEICLRDASQTGAINACYDTEVTERDAELQRYLDAAATKFEQDEVDPGSFNAAQSAWEAYRDSYCDGAVMNYWEDASIGTASVLACNADLAASRSHQIWEDFLTNEDGPPELPEPSLP
jgi:uncharacterized protein YecT (DUF1311 family)